MPLITLTGPTCAGKSTVERELAALGYGRAISHTTRAPRAGETNGVEYYFVTDDQFESSKAADEFIEVIDFGDRKYAMSKRAILAALGEVGNAVIVVDPHGASQIREFCSANRIPAVSIWLDCAPGIQAARFLERMAGEMVRSGAWLKTYAERLGLMLSQESRWRDAAVEGRIRSGWFYTRQFNHTEHYDPTQLARIIDLAFAPQKPAQPTT